MIISFKDKDSALLASGVRVKRFEAFERIAYRKIRQLQIAASLNDLRIPPGNRLEALSGEKKRSIQYSYQRPVSDLLCMDSSRTSRSRDHGLSLTR